MGESGGIQEICEALDPNYNMIVGRFGRESTLLKNGKYIKDLTYLNRPLKEIVYVDFSDDSVAFHKENAIILPLFDGDSSDRDLIDLIPFLDRKYFIFINLIYFFPHFLDLAMYPGDVRKEIARYGKETCGKKFLEQQQMKL